MVKDVAQEQNGSVAGARPAEPGPGGLPPGDDGTHAVPAAEAAHIDAPPAAEAPDTGGQDPATHETAAHEPAAEAVNGVIRTGTEDSAAAARIVAIRERIDEIDRTLIELWHERARLSREVGATRMASGGTRLVLSREREILERFRETLGADGTQLALLLLRAGRGPL